MPIMDEVKCSRKCRRVVVDWSTMVVAHFGWFAIVISRTSEVLREVINFFIQSEKKKKKECGIEFQLFSEFKRVPNREAIVFCDKLRLPTSTWHPNFDTSARTIFFAGRCWFSFHQKKFRSLRIKKKAHQVSADQTVRALGLSELNGVSNEWTSRWLLRSSISCRPMRSSPFPSWICRGQLFVLDHFIWGNTARRRSMYVSDRGACTSIGDPLPIGELSEKVQLSSASTQAKLQLCNVMSDKEKSRT